VQDGFVSSETDDETKLRRDETTFVSGEDIRKPALRITTPTKRRANGPAETGQRPNDRGPS
jgi:hypothetical protein